MRTVAYEQVVAEVARLCCEANFYLGSDVRRLLSTALETEESPTGRDVLGQIIDNARIAEAEQAPMCQDTGLAVIFANMGQDVHVQGGYLYDAIQAGVRQGYGEGFLRKSVVRHPWRRENTGDNTPAIIHTTIVPGDRLRIVVAPKGGGSENMSRIAMLPPAAGRQGVKDFVVDTVHQAGPNPCPPVVVGVGVGGNFEAAALLAKRALLRVLGQANEDEEAARLEEELLTAINNLGIGPQGFGGTTTALAVNVLTTPCHIASLPVAVNINCHAHRHKEVVL